MKTIASVAALLAIAAVGVGCGGGDDSATGAGDEDPAGPVTTSSLSKAQFVKQVNAICEKNQTKQRHDLSVYASEHPGRSALELLDKALEAIYLPSMEARAAELRELGAPQGDEDQIEDFITTWEESIEVNRVHGAKAQASALKATEARKLAQRYGLTECDT
jgi:predicted NACHT family NTPase